MIKFHNRLVLTCIIGFGLFCLIFSYPKLHFSPSLTIYDANGYILYESAQQRSVSLQKVPVLLQKCIVVAEDRSFWSNIGIDLKAIIRAALNNLNANNITQGASTISQQLIKIGAGRVEERNIVTKAKEALSAILLNVIYSKNSILEKYINNVYMGNQIYGMQAASNVYLNKDISRLSVAESAFLTAIISSPEKFNPLTHYDDVKLKQSTILQTLYQQHFISKEQYENALIENIIISNSETETNAPHFVNYVREELNTFNLNNSNGLKVYTTLNLNAYKKALTISRYWISELGKQHNLTNASLISIDNSTGKLEVMMGGISYFDFKNSGQVNMSVALRQPGSSIKPVTYAAAFNMGLTAGSPLNDVQTAFSTKTGEGYTPRNYDNTFHGTVLAREALASSLNVPAVEVLNYLGLENFLVTAKKLGITTLNNSNIDLAVTLGGGEIKLIELTNAYASFARSGKYLPVYDIEKITDQDGKELYKYNQPTTIPIFGDKSAEVSYILSDILSDPKARMFGFGEKNPLVLSHPAAVKTGTTSDWHDVWTVGYTPDKTVGVWVGNNNNAPMKNISGVTGAAPIWHQFFEEILKGQPIKVFEQPKSIISKWICKDPKITDITKCNNKYEEYFIPGTENAQTFIQKTRSKIVYPLNNAVFTSDSSLNTKSSITFVVKDATECSLNNINIKIDNNLFTWLPKKGLYTLKCEDESVNFTVE